jgi:hypothetical protein
MLYCAHPGSVQIGPRNAVVVSVGAVSPRRRILFGEPNQTTLAFFVVREMGPTVLTLS